jgi:hypothetical protein
MPLGAWSPSVSYTRTQSSAFPIFIGNWGNSESFANRANLETGETWQIRQAEKCGNFGNWGKQETSGHRESMCHNYCAINLLPLFFTTISVPAFLYHHLCAIFCAITFVPFFVPLCLCHFSAIIFVQYYCCAIIFMLLLLCHFLCHWYRAIFQVILVLLLLCLYHFFTIIYVL